MIEDALKVSTPEDPWYYFLQRCPINKAVLPDTNVPTQAHLAPISSSAGIQPEVICFPSWVKQEAGSLGVQRPQMA